MSRLFAVLAIFGFFALVIRACMGRGGDEKFGAVLAIIVLVAGLAVAGGSIFFFFYTGHIAFEDSPAVQEEWRRCPVDYLEGTWEHQDKGVDMVITPDFRAYFLAEDKTVTHTYDMIRREGKVHLARHEHDYHVVLSSTVENKLLLGQTTECEHCNKIAGRYRRALTGVELPINLGE